MSGPMSPPRLLDVSSGRSGLEIRMEPTGDAPVPVLPLMSAGQEIRTWDGTVYEILKARVEEYWYRPYGNDTERVTYTWVYLVRQVDS